MRRSAIAKLLTLGALLAAGLSAPQPVLAHCDGMDGPVVKAAQRALATGNVSLVLVWVQPGDEAEIRKSFTRTLAVRKLNPQAQELADLYFFETLVRIHRAGEGEPYTGLKPAGRDLGPAIPAADKAVESGSADSLARLIADAAGQGVRQRFQEVISRKNFSRDDVKAGREYVKAYVEFIHHVEALHEAVHGGGHEHSQASEAAAMRAAH